MTLSALGGGLGGGPGQKQKRSRAKRPFHSSSSAPLLYGDRRPRSQTPIGFSGGPQRNVTAVINSQT